MKKFWKVKKWAAFALAVVLLLGLFPLSASAAVSDLKLSIEVQRVSLPGSGEPGIRYDFKLKTGSEYVNGLYAVTFEYDSTKLQLVNATSGAAINTTSWPVGADSGICWVNSAVAVPTGAPAAITGHRMFVVKETKTPTRIFAELQFECTTFNTLRLSEYTTVCSLYFKETTAGYVSTANPGLEWPDTTDNTKANEVYDDLNRTFLLIMNSGEYWGVITVETDDNGPIAGTAEWTAEEDSLTVLPRTDPNYKTQSQLRLIYRELGSLEITGTPTVAVPTGEEANTLDLTGLVQAKDTEGDGMDAPPLTWKLYTAASGGSEVNVDGVTFEKGVLTVGKAAAGAITADTSYYAAVTSGSVTSPRKEVKITRPASVATGVKLAADDQEVTDTHNFANIRAGDNVVFQVTATDQFGQPMPAGTAVTWTNGTLTNVTFTGGNIAGTAGKATATLTAGAAAESGSVTVKAQVGAQETKVFTVNIKSNGDLVIKPKAEQTPIPDLDRGENGGKTLTGAGLDPATYGANYEAVLLENNTETPTDGTWSFKTPTQTLAWGANTVTLTFTAENGKTADVDVTVYVKQKLDSGNIQVSDKTYDGTTDLAADAAFTIKTADQAGVLGGKTITLAAEGSYDSPAVGDDSAVTLTKLTVSGTDAGYFYVADPLTGKAAGSIKPATLTVAAKASVKLPVEKLDSFAPGDFLTGAGDDILNDAYNATVTPTAVAADDPVKTLAYAGNGNLQIKFFALGDGMDFSIVASLTADDLASVLEDVATMNEMTPEELAEYVEGGGNLLMPVTAAKLAEDTEYVALVTTKAVAGTGSYAISNALTNQIVHVNAKEEEEEPGGDDEPGGGGGGGDIVRPGGGGGTPGGGAVEPTPPPEPEKIHKGYIQGRELGLFTPNGTMTRAEAVTMLARVSDGFEEDGDYTTDLFPDVSSSYWGYKYIAFGAANGLITGYEDGTFKPDAHVSRAEFSAMVARFMGLEPADGPSTLPDVAGSWAEGYIVALQQKGIVIGYLDGTFKPKATLVRSEAVKMVNGALDRIPDADLDLAAHGYSNPFRDVSVGDWFFAHAMEAAIDHAPAEFHTAE